MRSDILRWTRRVVLIVLGGLVLSVAAFSVTSYASYKYLGGPDMVYLAYPGFDPLTGLPRGVVIEGTVVDGQGGSTRVTHESMPPDMVGRRAIPLPVGFAIGVIVMIGVLAVISRPRRPAASVVA
jgi:hypothetical protein